MSRATVTRVVLTLCALLALSAPAFAQIDLTGSWNSRLHEDWMERCCGRDLGDYTGIGINDEARAKALSWDASLNSLRERQCLLFSPWTGQFQPQGVRIWSEIDADGNVIAWNLSGNVQKDIVTIWMDGRPHPSANAFHDFSGFTTGKWEGDTLTASTTHMKTAILRRSNGIPKSDLATATVHITRHDDLLTIVTIEEDPIYLAEPLFISRTYQLDPRGEHRLLGSVQRGDGDPAARGHRDRPALSARREPEPDLHRRDLQDSAGSGDGVRRDPYPGVPQEAQRHLQAAGRMRPVLLRLDWVGGGSVNPAPTLSCNDTGEGKTVAESGI